VGRQLSVVCGAPIERRSLLVVETIEQRALHPAVRHRFERGMAPPLGEDLIRVGGASRWASGRQLAVVADGRVIATPAVRGTLDQGEIAVRVERERVDAAYAALHE